jgi:hypothetical protein
LTLWLEDGGLRYVRLGDLEIVRRVYVAVRDPSWATAEAQLSELSLTEDAGGGFRATFTVTNRLGPIAFRWQGTVTGAANGGLSFTMEGEALSDFQANRIGICVLHPVEPLRGRAVRIETVDGHDVVSEFPETIRPHLLFANLRALAFEAGGVEAAMRLEGDTYETEDQRNWGDASFKTYARPLALPKPFDLKKGQKIAQSFALELSAVPSVTSGREAAADVDLAIDTSIGYALPALGLGLPPGRERHTPGERARLARLSLAHVRAELVPARAGTEEIVRAAAEEARALEVGLDLAVFVSRAPKKEVQRLADALAAVGPPLSAVTLSSLVDEVPARDVRRLVAAVLAQVTPNVPIAIGAFPYFAELNGNRDVADATHDLVFPLSPQVHMNDDRTLAENVVAPVWMGETVRSFAKREVALAAAPVSLRPWPRTDAGAVAGAQTRAAAAAALASYTDVRQATLFAAGWTALSVAALARGRFARATFFQTCGPLGVMAADDQPLPEGFPPAVVFPVFHVLADIAEWGDAQVFKVRSSAPLDVGALAMHGAHGLRILIANLTEAHRKVNLDVGARLGSLRRLGASEVELACARPDAFRAAQPSRWTGGPLELGRHEVLRLDLDA